MDEEFVFQVTEEELAQFPEEGNQSQEEQGPQEHPKGLESKDQILQESTEKQERENNKLKIPSLLDLKLPKLYAASRNGRWNKGTGVQKGGRECRRRRGQSGSKPRSSIAKQSRWGQSPCHPRKRRR